jgi:U3 small nucleolar RNA-associated protein 14
VAKSKNKLRKRQRETEDEVAKARDDAVLEITPTDLLLAPPQGSRRTRARTSSSNSDEDDEVEEQEERLKRKVASRKSNAFRQKDLVTMAFAGDNVVEVCVFRGCFGAILTLLVSGVRGNQAS